MQKKRLRPVSAAVILALIVAGCGASGTENSAVQQESLVETDTNVEETQPDTETQTDAEIRQETVPESETYLQAESQEETEPQKTEEGLEMPETEKNKTQPEATAESEMEVQSHTKIQQPAAEGSVSASDYTVSVRGTTVALWGDMRDYVSALGEPDGYSAAKSCVEAGEDKIYIYGGITIYTYVTNGADRITLIEITGNEALPSGIRIGSTKADVIGTYGSGFMEEGTELLYETDGKTLGLQMEGDTVSFMELFGR